MWTQRLQGCKGGRQNVTHSNKAELNVIVIVSTAYFQLFMFSVCIIIDPFTSLLLVIVVVDVWNVKW